MNVLQLIDSLDAGGAERMAVNLANVLNTEIEGSFLCVTRKEGLLKDSIGSAVGYCFLNRKYKLDVKAIKALNAFVRSHDIQIIHAHSTSFFLATVIKILNPKLKLVWHDHYGNRSNNSKGHYILKLSSNFFSHVFAVNDALLAWSEKNLKVNSITYLPNFVIEQDSIAKTVLYGSKGKRIVSLANLRYPKDHANLLRAFRKIVDYYPDWTLHLVGKDYEDDYSRLIKRLIKELDLINHVYIYGSCPDVGAILSQCEIGVISSKTEGLPLALLEYGLYNLAVVSTNVGQCKEVLLNGECGLLVQPENSEDLEKAICNLIADKMKREQLAGQFSKHVNNMYSSKAVLEKVLKTYNRI